MDKYDCLQQIGDGTFGSVIKAVHKKTGQLVAVKRMKQKYYTWDECVNLPEVQVLRKLQAHPNIIKLREVVRENNDLFFVFEFMDGDLLGVIRKHKQNQLPQSIATAPAVPHAKVKSYMYQLLQALSFLHKSGYFHRDLKPENLLIRKDPVQSQEVVKLADFGLVKEVRTRPPYTDYVSTRWYRAPELLLQDRAYTCAVDIWAAGCIFCELMTTKPLFPGNNEVDQLFKIMSVFGSPTEATWPDGMQLARKIRYQFPLIQGTPLKAILPSYVPASAIDLITKMLVYDPKKRITAQQCLTHPYFNVGLDEEPLSMYSTTTTARPVGGTQSAPTAQAHMATPLQWRQAAEKDGGYSANKLPPTILNPTGVSPAAAAVNAGRPASGSRPMFPPVEISKHTVTSNPSNGASGAPGLNSDGSSSMSKYYLVPTGLSPKVVSNVVAHGSNNPSGGGGGGGVVAGSSKIAGAPPPPPALPTVQPAATRGKGSDGGRGTPTLSHRPPTKLDAASSPFPALQQAQSNAAASTAKLDGPIGASSSALQKARPPKSNKAGNVDLDQLMEEFQAEMASFGFLSTKDTTTTTTVTGAAAAPTGSAAAAPGGYAGLESSPPPLAPGTQERRASLRTTTTMLPGGASSTTNQTMRNVSGGTPTSTVGVKGLPQPLLSTAGDGTSPLQKLLNSSRYKPSFQSSNSPTVESASSGVAPHQQSQQLLAPVLQAAAIHSPMAVTAATRYDLDSSSFASVDAGSVREHKQRHVAAGQSVTPSVVTLLNRQSFKPATLPVTTDEDDDLPTWLKMVNDKTKRATPTEFSKGGFAGLRR